MILRQQKLSFEYFDAVVDGGERICPSCSQPIPAHDHFYSNRDTRPLRTMDISDDLIVPLSTTTVRLTLQSEIQRPKRVLQHSREQEAASRRANEVPPMEFPCSGCGELNSEFEMFCRECGHDIEIPVPTRCEVCLSGLQSISPSSLYRISITMVILASLENLG